MGIFNKQSKLWLTCCRNWKLLLSFWKKRFPREISRCIPDVFHEVVFNEDVATSLGFRQGICSSHLTLCLTLDFIFELCSKACPDWKSSCTFFAGTCWSHDHVVIGEKYLVTKPINFGVNGKRILYWSIFAVEPTADFCHLWVIDLQRMRSVTMV